MMGTHPSRDSRHPNERSALLAAYADGPVRYVLLGKQSGGFAYKRQQSEIARLRVAAEIAEIEHPLQSGMNFSDWADRWLDSLERKPSTIGSYRSTIAHAKKTFCRQFVGELAAEDIARFNRALREQGCSPSTRAKHLRVLGACLQAALFYRLA